MSRQASEVKSLEAVPIGSQVRVRRVDMPEPYTYCTVVKHFPCLTRGDLSSVEFMVEGEANVRKTLDQLKKQCDEQPLVLLPEPAAVRPPAKSAAAKRGPASRPQATPAAKRPVKPASKVPPSRPTPKSPPSAVPKSTFPLLVGEIRFDALAFLQQPHWSAGDLKAGMAHRVFFRETSSPDDMGGWELCVLHPSQMELLGSSTSLDDLLQKPLVVVGVDQADILEQFQAAVRVMPLARADEASLEPLVWKQLMALKFSSSKQCKLENQIKKVQRFHRLYESGIVGARELELLRCKTHAELARSRLAHLTARFTNRKQPELVIELHLESRAFDTKDCDPAGARPRKALRDAILSMVDQDSLRLGPECDLATLNFLGGVKPWDVGAGKDVSVSDYDVNEVIKSVVVKDGEQRGLSDDTRELLHSKLQPETRLFDFQERGVRWCIDKEEQQEPATLSPEWVQLRTQKGQLIYLNTLNGRFATEKTEQMMTAVADGTAGGMLCDDVGLGKTIQMLSLVASNPAPASFGAVHHLPSCSEEAVRIKATLVVAPRTVLGEWQLQLSKHFREGALVYCVHTEAETRLLQDLQSSEWRERNWAAQDEAARKGRHRSRTDHWAAQDEQQLNADFNKILPAGFYRNGLFAGPLGSDGLSLIAPRIEDCDVILVSYEAIRDQQAHWTPGIFTRLGFWRIVLDEAQQVADSQSQAALMCSDILRANAWVTTGTPASAAKVRQLQGLLCFLNKEPFSEPDTWKQLVQKGFEDKDADSLPRLRTVLRTVMLRRSKEDPAVAAEIGIEDPIWENRVLMLSNVERGTYQVACARLMKSRGEYEGSTVKKDLQRQRSRLMGDLTRLRQMICNPFVIDETREQVGTGTMTSFLVGSQPRSQTVIMARLIVKAHAEHELSQVEHMRHRAVLLAGECAQLPL